MKANTSPNSTSNDHDATTDRGKIRSRERAWLADDREPLDTEGVSIWMPGRAGLSSE